MYYKISCCSEKEKSGEKDKEAANPNQTPQQRATPDPKDADTPATNGKVRFFFIFGRNVVNCFVACCEKPDRLKGSLDDQAGQWRCKG